jgi:hypothetical protein
MPLDLPGKPAALSGQPASVSKVEPAPWWSAPGISDDPRFRDVYHLLPEFGHLAHHLHAARKSLVNWCKAQRATGLDGRVIAWRDYDPPENLIPGPDIKDHDAVFRYFLEAADCSDADAKKRIVDQKTDPFSAIRMGVLIGEGPAAHIASGVLYTQASCEVSFQENWYKTEDYERDNLLDDFWTKVERAMSWCGDDYLPTIMPEGITQSHKPDWDALDGTASILRALGEHCWKFALVNDEKTSGTDGYGGSLATYGFVVLVKPPVSLVKTALGWGLNGEAKIIESDRSVTFNAFYFDGCLRRFLEADYRCPRQPAKLNDMLRALSLWYNTNERVVDFKRAIAREERKRTSKGASLQFIVPKWIPRGTVTLLAADGSTGKTTLLHDLVKIVGTPLVDRTKDRTWLNVPLNEIAHGAATMFTAEEPEEWIDERDDALDPDGVSLRGACWDGTGLGLDAIIAQIEGQPDLALMVIDPARKFLDGNESSSEDVDRLLTKLQDLARKKNCAVVVVHHLTKGGGGARGLSGPFGVKDYIRGSQVWVDRPRCVIAMQRKGSDADGWIASLKVVKSNVPPAYPMATDLQSFRMDAKTRTLLPIGEGKSKSAKQSREGKADAPTAAEIETVCAVVSEIVAGGGKVTRTGRRELFGRVPALAGIPRSRLRRTVAAALAAGPLKLTEENYIELSASP